MSIFAIVIIHSTFISIITVSIFTSTSYLLNKCLKMRKTFMFIHIVSISGALYFSVKIKISFCIIFFLPQKTSFNISYSTNLMVMNSFSTFFWLTSLFFTIFERYFKDIVPLPSCLHVFWWKVCFHSYFCSTECIIFLSYFKKVSLSLVFTV